ncbi:PQQ-binding-like beta-propeller repeat protein [Stieleria varia]|nr:PQQ-binding-like beta-propeller repeat protein [Stieleria varia]
MPQNPFTFSSLRPVLLFSSTIWLWLALSPVSGITPAAFAEEPTQQLSWPRFLGANFDNAAVTGGLQYDWSQTPEFLWSLPVGEGYGMGAAADNRYYQFDADVQSGETVERLRCVDLDTGETLWQSSTPFQYRDMLGYEAGPRSTPTLAGEHVYTFGVTGILCCRKISDGETVWSVDTNKRFSVVQNFFGVGSSPLVVGDSLIVPVGGSPPEDASIAPGRLDRVSPAGSALVAFDRNNGKQLWASGGDLSSYSSPRTMQIDGKTVVLYFARDHLLALDPTDGRVLWTHYHRARILESVNAMVPVVDGAQVFISECYEIGSVLLSAKPTGVEVVWQDPQRNRRLQSMRCHWSTPALIDGYLYGCSGRNGPDSDFRCVKWSTGEVMWVDNRRTRSSVAQVNDHLLVWDEGGQLQVIKPNPKGLDVIAAWDMAEPAQQSDDKDAKIRPALSYPCWSAPIVIGDRLLLRGDQYVVCLRLATR